MASVDGERYAFIVHWLDPHASITWKYQLFYYNSDKTVEMYDIKNKRIFLKRSECPAVRPENLFLGAIITLHSRQLHVVEYGDEFTKTRLETRQETTLAMIKPDAIANTGKILSEVYAAGFQVKRLRMCHLGLHEAKGFYAVHADKPFFPTLTQFMSSGRIVAMELVGQQAIAKWRALIGPTNTEKARVEAPQSLRARFGTDGTRNACHGSDAPETARQETEFFFRKPPVGRCARLEDCSLCIIKPHAVLKGMAGEIIDIIGDSFLVSSMEIFNLDRANAMEFYEIYKGVVNEFSAMVDELTSGPFIALEIVDPRGPGSSPVEAFRQLCGPPDPEIARVLRPNSLRARFGIDKVKNAVHCTDLPEDGVLEAQFFFDILQS